MTSFNTFRQQAAERAREQEAEIRALEAKLQQLHELNRTLQAQGPAPPGVAPGAARTDACRSGNATLKRALASPGDLLKYAKKPGAPSDEECARLVAALTPAHNCTALERMGRAGAGGYDVCLDARLPAPSTACVAYSYGLGQDWAYEIELSGQCYTYAFDPTLFKKPNKLERYEGRQIDFHKIGLTADGRNFCHRGATEVRTKTLAGAMRHLGHSQVDVLKLSVDEAEWEVLVSLAGADSPLRTVSQMVAELHFHHVPMATALRALAVLEEQGFVLFSSSWAAPAPAGRETFKCGLMVGQVSYLKRAA